MSSGEKIKKEFSITVLQKRLLAIFIAVTFLFVFVLGRLFFVQVIWGEELQEKAIDQWTREIPVVARRGKIIDTNGVLLATNKDTYTVFVRKSAAGDLDALSVALSFVLSCIRLYRMPQGGSVTPASMLPIMLFSAVYGVGPGLLTGLVYGVLQYLQGGWFLNIWQFSLDYLLTFAALGLAGLSRNLPEKWGLYVAMVIAAVGRALSATLAGIMFWESAPVASLIYNGTYLIPEIVICIILAVAIAKPVMRIMKSASR